MLLRSLYDFAVSHNLLDDLAFKKDTPVRFVIHLNKDGHCLGVQDTALLPDFKTGMRYDTPKSARPSNSGLVADFLVEEINAIFGLNTKPEKELNDREASKLLGKASDFWLQVEKAAKDAEIGALVRPLLLFRDRVERRPFSIWTLPFAQKFAPLSLKWKPSRAGGAKPVWELSTLTGESVEVGASAVAFDVDGVRLITDDRIRGYWLRAYEAESASAEEAGTKGVCLVTGMEDVPIAQTHTPMVTGFPRPARPTGAGLVSGDKDAFLSYGLDQALNAPTSITASRAYLRALQHLVGREEHSFRLGPATLLWWTERSTFPLRPLLVPNRMAISSFMKSIGAGTEREPQDLEWFTSVTFGAAGPRLVVRNWIRITVAEAKQNFAAWFEDLNIEGIDYGLSAMTTKGTRKTQRSSGEALPEYLPYSVHNLAYATIRPGPDGRYDAADLAPELVSTLYAAALHGSAPPLSLLKPLLDRLRARMAKDGSKALREHSRFAFLKLILLRNPDPTSTMNIAPKLADTDDPAYNCGRLLSVFNALQRRAHKAGEGSGKLNTSLAERYFGSASTTPHSAFGIMWRLHQHHLKKLRQAGKKGENAAFGFTNAIMNICSRFGAAEGAPPAFKRVFTLQEQGRFALGFYQQEAARAESIRLWKEEQARKGAPISSDEDDEAPLEIETVTPVTNS